MAEPFLFTRRVEFCETDMAGIMHYSNYFRFMEAAETAFLRSRGLTVYWWEGEYRYGFPRVSVGCDFASPLRFEDVMTLAVTVEKVGAKSVTYRFDMTSDSRPVAVGRITSVYCRSNPKHEIESLIIPDELRQKLLGAATNA